MSNTNSWLRKLFIGSATLVALFAVAGSALFFASPSAAASVESNAPVSLVSDTTEVQTVPVRNGNGRSSISNDNVEAAVADALGLTVEEFEAAREEGASISDLAEAAGVSEEALDEVIYEAKLDSIAAAVEAGDLTAEQGEALTARVELSYLKDQVIDEDVLKSVKAEALGLTVEEYEAAREEGMRTSELAEAAGTTKEAVKEAVQAAKADMVNQAVEDGILTAEQGEELLESNGRNGRRGNGRRGNPQQEVQPEAEA